MTIDRADSSGAFAVLIAAGPFLLPVLGVHVGDLLFCVPLVLCAYACVLGARAAACRPQRRLAWRAIAGATAAATAASGLAVVTGVLDVDPKLGLYAGGAGSVLLLAGCGALAREAWRVARPIDAVDPLVVAGVVVAVAVDLVVVPGVERGDLALTAVLACDLAALVLAALATLGTLPTPAKAALALGLVAVVAGDGLAAAQSAHLAGGGTGLIALLWAITGACCAAAAAADARSATVASAAPARGAPTRTWARAYGRLLLPLGAMTALPLACAAHLLGRGGLSTGIVVFYAVWFLATAAVVFARQAHLLVENRRAVHRERALRAEAQRRATELEALTGLATTMTEVLDEDLMAERGLDALRVAARTSSAALHLPGEDAGDPRLAAANGAWRDEAVWAAPLLVDRVDAEVRGHRHVARLPVAARGRTLGVVTLVRPAGEGAFDGELPLLRLLADQLGVGIQNARDHRDRLEAALRDPLTGLYDRRYFYEAFEKEVRRHERYGTSASLVLFDVDDLKTINEAIGQRAADEVLQRIAKVVAPLIRPSDSLARLGGGEFALLLPETGQLDALLAAERMRTAVSRHEILSGRQVTLSGGVAALPQDGTTREQLERRADAARAWAKRNGKNLCAVAREVEDAAAPGIAEGMLAHLHAVVAGIDSAHLHTRDHSENVAAYAVAIAQAMGLDAEHIVHLRRAAFLHDIGKIAVPDAVLSKPAALTDVEYAQIKVHPEVGGHMLAHAGLLDEARWVRHHHERVDGRGYPDGVAGTALPLESRIIFVADSFEAMTSDRPYRRGMPVPDAVAELRRCSGTQFDPLVVDALCDLLAGDRLTVLALRDAA